MIHPILKILEERKTGKKTGIPSYCTANRQVIRTILKDAAKNHRTVLIEATANQVDQFGGYTGMTPKDYVRFMEGIAAETGCALLDYEWGGSCITNDDTQFFDGFHLDEKYGLPDWTAELFDDMQR